MTSIKSLKKGDWVIFSKIVCNDGNYTVPEEYSNLFLFFQTNKKCIVGKYQKYNKMKYWFEVNEKELVDTEIYERNEIINLYDNYDIEIHKIRVQGAKHWSNYYRSKRDYNWKYDLALGICANWVYCKRDLLNSYLQDLKEARKFKNPLTIKYMEEAVDNLIDGLREKTKCGSTFMRPSSILNNVDINKNVVFYDIMLNNYASLGIKYRNKVDNEIYYMLLDFEKVAMYAKKNLLSKIDAEIMTMIMDGQINVNKLTDYINTNYKFKKPLKPENIKFKINEEIPKILLKASNILEKTYMSEELYGEQ